MKTCGLFSDIHMDGSRKRGPPNENQPATFVVMTGPPTKRIRRVLQPIMPEDPEIARQKHEAYQHTNADRQQQIEVEKHRQQQAEAHKRLEQVLGMVKEVGYKSLNAFMNDLFTSDDRKISSQVSRMLNDHGDEILDNIRNKQVRISDEWIARNISVTLEKEGLCLVDAMRPEGHSLTAMIQNFSLGSSGEQMRKVAPTLYTALSQVVGIPGNQASGRKDKEVVSYQKF